MSVVKRIICFVMPLFLGFCLRSNGASRDELNTLLFEKLGTGRHVALITGGSRGIGGAMADLLAERGVDLILVASNKKNLAAKANELRDKKVIVHTIAQDLSLPGAASRVWNDIPRALKKNLSIFIFSAGLAVSDRGGSREQIKAMHQIKGPTVRELGRLFLDHASSSRRSDQSEAEFRSLTLLVGSLAEVVEPGGYSQYVLSNRSITSAAQNFYERYRSEHLVGVLAPGFTKTEMLESVIQLPYVPGVVQTPHEVAYSGLIGALKGQHYVTTSDFYAYTAPLGHVLNRAFLLAPLQAAQALTLALIEAHSNRSAINSSSPRRMRPQNPIMRALTAASGFGGTIVDACERILRDDDYFDE